jgi:hypothetical protein
VPNISGQGDATKLFGLGTIGEPSVLVFIKNFKSKKLVVVREDINTFSAPYLRYAALYGLNMV